MSAQLALVRPAEATDAALVGAHLRGSPDAFDELCRRYRPALLALLTRKVGDRHLAEDLTQVTLLKAYQALPRFDPSRRMWSWLVAIASNAAVDHLRSAQSRQVPHEPGHFDADAVAGQDPAAQVLERAVLRQALERLSPRHRRVVSLRDIEDRPMAQVARMMHLGANATVKLHNRALDRLRREYREITVDSAPALVSPLVWLVGPLRRWLTRARQHLAALQPVTAAGYEVAMANLVAVTLAASLTVVSALGAPVPDAPRTESPGLSQPAPREPRAQAPAAAIDPGGAPRSRKPPPAAQEPTVLDMVPPPPGPVPRAEARTHFERDGGHGVVILGTEAEDEDGDPAHGEAWIQIPCDGIFTRLLCDVVDDGSGSAQ